jgi:DNA-binding CsgD family transcriptional regulator
MRGAGGVWLSGPAGVGKTRLAHAISEAGTAAGGASLWLSATPGMKAIPLGPFRHLLDLDDATDAPEADMWRALERAVRDAAGEGALLVAVDDAHHLDDLSAAFVHRLATSGSTFVVVTLEEEAPRPDALTAMWKDGLVERIDIGVLDRDQAEEILRDALGGDVERPTVQSLWSHSGGNVLLLRELTLSALEDGTLTKKDAIWSWRGRGRVSARLREVVATRLGRLSEPERAALEYVAVGGALPRETLRVLAGDDALDALEERGLLVAEVIDGVVDLSVSHSVYADVLRNALRGPRLRVLRRQIVRVTARTTPGRSLDAVRLAILRLEAGETVDPVTLRTAASAVLWHAGRLLAENVATTARSLPLPLGSEGGVALRLARAAWRQTGDVTSGIDLAVTYAWLGLVDDAEQLLLTLEGRAVEDDERARIATARATLLFWGLGRPAEAIAVLRAAEDACRAIADNVSHRELRRARAGIELNVARPGEALALSQEVIDTGPDDLASARAQPAVAAALAMMGRCEEALAVVDEHLPRAFERLDSSPLMAVQLMTARNRALVGLGRVDDSRRLAEECLAVALVGEAIDGVAVFESWAGRARLLAGDVQSARRHLIESEALFAERDPLALRPWVLFSIAQANVWGNDLDAARRALAEADAIRRFDRYFDSDLHLARVLLATAERRTRDATDEIAEAVARATAAEMPVDAAIVWHASVRLGRAAQCAEPLARLAAQRPNPFVATMAAHARASAAGDAAGLEAVGSAFAGLGLQLHALEAVSEALDTYERAGRTRSSRALAGRCAELAAACPGALPVWIGTRNPPPSLTRRENEIARLAADGLPSRLIADRLAVSVRTVDSHLYRVYLKLGVRDRAGLAAALSR